MKIQVYIPFLDIYYDGLINLGIENQEVEQLHLIEWQLKERCRELDIKYDIEYSEYGNSKLWKPTKYCTCGCDGECMCDDTCPHHDYIIIYTDGADWITFNILDFKIEYYEK